LAYSLGLAMRGSAQSSIFLQPLRPPLGRFVFCLRRSTEACGVPAALVFMSREAHPPRPLSPLRIVPHASEHFIPGCLRYLPLIMASARSAPAAARRRWRATDVAEWASDNDSAEPAAITSLTRPPTPPIPERLAAAQELPPPIPERLPADQESPEPAPPGPSATPPDALY
jgi:hypothetical protein